jgi:hypothetical protein
VRNAIEHAPDARYGAGTVRTGHPRPEARDEVPFNAPRDLPLAGELGPERLGVERQVGPNVAEGDGNYREVSEKAVAGNRDARVLRRSEVVPGGIEPPFAT